MPQWGNRLNTKLDAREFALRNGTHMSISKILVELAKCQFFVAFLPDVQ